MIRSLLKKHGMTGKGSVLGEQEAEEKYVRKRETGKDRVKNYDLPLRGEISCPAC